GERRGAAAGTGMGRRSSGLPRDLPQLVERAEDVGQGTGHRPHRLARLVDGEFSVDARHRRRPAEGAAPAGEHGAAATPGSGGVEGAHRRRQLRRPLPALRRRRPRAMAGGRGGNARAARRLLGRCLTMRFLVWGAGAIGGTMGACLARAGHDVTLVDTVVEHVDAIDRSGLSISGPVTAFTVRLPAFTPPGLTGTWDAVILATKAHHTEAAARALLPY